MNEDFEKNSNGCADESAPAPEAPKAEPAEAPQNAPAQTPEQHIPYEQKEIPKVQAEPVNTPPQRPSSPDTEQPYSPYSSRPYVQPQNRPVQPPVYGNQPRPGYVQTPPVQPPTPPSPPKKGMSSGSKILIALVSIILVIAIAFGSIVIFKPDLFSKAPATNGTSAPVAQEGADEAPLFNIAGTPAAEEGALTTAEIAEKVKPSIVGIVVYSGNDTSNSAGEGTGVVMGVDDTNTFTYIVTCAHVINDPGVTITIQTEDGTSYPASIVGYDTRTDLGVLKVEATGFVPAEFGDSNNLRVGDSVYAIGNPGGIEFFGSFTGGFVSAIDRPVNSEIGYTMKCIQHDAAINPGNSGGALVNVYGQVIGINSQKIAATEFEGMGFAIPTSSAQSIIDSLIRYGYVPNRPKLGITYYPVAANSQYYMIARMNNLPAGTLIIDEISADSSLANTEARRYDMIIAVNGESLTTADVLLERIDNGAVGDTFTLTLCRVNSNYSIETFDVTVTLVEDRSSSASSEQPTEPEYAIDPFG